MRLVGALTATGLRKGGGGSELADVASYKPDWVINLVGAVLTEELEGFATCLRLTLEGLDPRGLVDAVRRKLGVRDGQVQMDWWLDGAGGPKLVFRASCCLDHRSLQRSLDMVLLKTPMALQAALRRAPLPNQFVPEPEIPVQQSGQQIGALRLLARLGLNAIKWVFLRDQWRIRLFRAQVVGGHIESWVDLVPDAGAFWADPFLIDGGDGSTHVLFEELSFQVGRGRIAALSVDRNGQASKPKIVVDEPWHLSYPFLLTWQNHTYMIPESSANRTVDLYICEEMPGRWRKLHTLLEGPRLADATLVHWNGRWWMFAAHAQDGACLYDELNLYWAADLLGPWRAHALNPVKINARGARPAGALFVDNGRLIRPTQDCANVYGGAVVFQEILQLDEQGFIEREFGFPEFPQMDATIPVHTFNTSSRVSCIDSLHRLVRRPT